MNRRNFLKSSSAMVTLAPLGLAAAEAGQTGATAAPTEMKGYVRATDFESQVIFRGRQNYAAWCAFFPGENGQWYLTCEEIWKSARKPPRLTRQQTYESGMPIGYDESQMERELVMLESRDDLKTWQVISREPCRLRHSAGTFAQARTKDGRFLRFGWATQWMDPSRPLGKIAFVSADNGKTWQDLPEFHSPRFASWAHRLRTLRDGTLVLAIPFSLRTGQGTDCPVRACANLSAESSMWMNLCFSYDQGRTWTAPLPIYGGHEVSETDFVELPAGDLLCINNSIFGRAGRQMIYRTAQGWMPGPYERAAPGTVPETVCLTPEGILVGCLRAGRYFWSHDLGMTWQKLEGVPDRGPEVYQPWIQYLPDGRIACAGHYGADNFLGELNQYLNLHTFRVEVLRKPKDAKIELERDFDEAQSRWKNAYTLKLTCDGKPLADKELEFWFAERWKPGYEDWPVHSLEERMKMGGETIRVRTDGQGIAHVAIPRLDAATSIHHYIQLVVRFNADHRDPDYKPTQTPQIMFPSLATY